MKLSEFKKSYALITGASEGLGRAFAEAALYGRSPGGVRRAAS